MDEKMNNELDEKVNNDRPFEYCLELTDEELNKLLFCSRHAEMSAGDFLRMLVNDCYESILENGKKNE